MLILDTRVSNDVKPASISQESVRDGDKVTLLGWGRTDPLLDSFASTLQEVKVSAYTSTTCASKRPDLPFSSDHFCDGTILSGKGGCIGDSGGPVVDSTGAVIGIMTKDAKCGVEPEVDALISNEIVRNWIVAQVV